jgi:alpha-tubulin suppressor-like RCC1 family protein
MEDLSPETILKLSLFLPIKEASRLSRCNQYFNDLIYNNNYFWREKYIFDFSNKPKNIINWREAYKNYGKVFGFGYNDYHQLGLEDNDNRYIPMELSSINAKSVVCGGFHTMIIDLEDNVWSFGKNEDGQLGLGLDLDFSKGNNKPIQIPNLKGKSISCGTTHTMVIDLDDNIWVFGDNLFGQLGLGDFQNRYAPIGLTHMGQPFKAKSVSCGSYNTTILDLNNNVWIFGNNLYERLGINSDIDPRLPIELTYMGKIFKAKTVSCGKDFTILIDMNDNLWSFGCNQSGQLGLGDTIDRSIPTPVLYQDKNLKCKSAICGRDYVMVIDMNNDILGFGYNESGELGLGDNINRYIPTYMGQNFKAKSISCGQCHTIIIDLDDNIWCCGLNEDGQLGLGYYVDRYIPTKLQGIKARSVSCGSNHSMIIL